MKYAIKLAGIVVVLLVLVMPAAFALKIPNVGGTLPVSTPNITPNTTATEQQTTLLSVKEISGVVFAPSKYAKKYVEGTLSDVKLPDFLEGKALKIYILFSQNDRAILLSDQRIPTSNARLEVVGIGFKSVEGYNWGVYYVKDVLECDTNGIPTTVDAILSSPSNYEFKLLNISTHYRAISFMFYSEKQSRALPVTVGYVSDHEKTLLGFLENEDKLASNLEKTNFDRQAIDKILNVRNGIGVFRIKPSYWIDADCYVKAILLGVNDFRAYMALINAKELNSIAIPENTKLILLEVDRNIKATPTTIYELKTSDLRGKQVVFECVGDGFNVSVKKTLEEASITLGSRVYEIVKHTPIDTIVQAEVFWYPPVPKLEELNKYSILAVGVLGSDIVPRSAVEPSGDLGKVLKVYAYVPRNRNVVIVESKKVVGNVNLLEVAGELKNRLNELKEKIKSETVQRITSRELTSRSKTVEVPTIEPGKPVTVEIGGIVNSIKLKVRNGVENAAISVKKLEELPRVPKLNAKVYAYLEINVSVSASNIEKATISFKVDKSWLGENGLKAGDVVLMKFSNGRWIQLETKVVGEDSQYVYYEANTTSFSIYAIAAKTSVTSNTTQTIPTQSSNAVTKTTANSSANKKTPGFGAVITLTSLLFLVLRRKL